MATAEVGVEGERIDVTTTYNEKDLIRAVAGSRWDPTRKIWTVPLSWGSCLALRGLFLQTLVVGDRLQAWAWNERQQRVDPSNEVRMAVEWAGGVKLDADLYSYQDVGSEFLVRARHALLADEMGTGKTVQTIRALRRLGDGAYPVCVISPNTAKQAWANEWQRWDPTVDVFVIRGSAAQRRKLFNDAEDAISWGRKVAVVINIEAVRRFSRLAPYGNVRLSDDEKTPKELNSIEWRTVVIDEAHRMKDPRSKQTRACWAVQHGSSVRYRYALTGTPIANHIGDLWSIMHGLAPHDYPTKTQYVDRYCAQAWSPFGDLEIIGVRPDTATEFYSILNPRIRSMPKELVLPFLPPKVRPVRYVEMSPKQTKAYKDLENDMITKLEDGSVLVASNELTRNIRLLQFSSAYCTIDGAGDVHLSEPSPKLDAMEEILDDLEGASMVVVAESRQLIEMAAMRLAKRNVQFRMIVGGVPEQERQRNIDDFQAGRAQVMLMTIKAGGVGITLTRAGTIVFLQRSWSMVDNKQCEDRVHRIGSEQHDKIVVIDIITTGTIEEIQIPRLHAKLIRLEEILRTRETLAANGDVEGLSKLDAELASIQQTPLWTNQEEVVSV
jgi:SNF2 family DNA or RNA helicase